MFLGVGGTPGEISNEGGVDAVPGLSRSVSFPSRLCRRASRDGVPEALSEDLFEEALDFCFPESLPEFGVTEPGAKLNWF